MSTASISWPGTIPKYPRFGWRQNPVDVSVRTQTDSGPGIARRRYTAEKRVLAATYRMKDKTEMDAFRTFYVTTTKGGSLKFNLWNPEDETQDVYRFMGPYNVTEVAFQVYDVQLRLEREPK